MLEKALREWQAGAEIQERERERERERDRLRTAT
jgi:hypothetical protein